MVCFLSQGQKIILINGYDSNVADVSVGCLKDVNWTFFG